MRSARHCVNISKSQSDVLEVAIGNDRGKNAPVLLYKGDLKTNLTDIAAEVASKLACVKSFLGVYQPNLLSNLPYFREKRQPLNCQLIPYHSIF